MAGRQPAHEIGLTLPQWLRDGERSVVHGDLATVLGNVEWLWVRRSIAGEQVALTVDEQVRAPSGNESELVELAVRNALAIGAGHAFVLLLAEGFYGINVLNTVKLVPEVCRIYCATANPVQVIVGETAAGRGILGVVDGGSPLGVEGEPDVSDRRELLRQLGYKP